MVLEACRRLLGALVGARRSLRALLSCPRGIQRRPASEKTLKSISRAFLGAARGVTEGHAGLCG
eukprot:4419494-Pyramimonas_sp.AAC.1